MYACISFHHTYLRIFAVDIWTHTRFNPACKRVFTYQLNLRRSQDLDSLKLYCVCNVTLLLYKKKMIFLRIGEKDYNAFSRWCKLSLLQYFFCRHQWLHAIFRKLLKNWNRPCCMWRNACIVVVVCILVA